MSKKATTMAALNQLAQIYRQLGQSEKAFGLLERCLGIAKEGVRRSHNSDPSRQNLAHIYVQLASVAEEYRRDMRASLAYNEEALKLYEDIFKNPSKEWTIDKKVVRAGLAEAYTRVGASHFRLGDLTVAEDNFRKALKLRQELAAEMPDDMRIKQDLSYSTMAIAELSFRLGDRAQADDNYRQTLEQRTRLFELKPKDLGVRKELGDVHYMVGEFKLKTGDLAAARQHLDRCKEIRAALVKDEPKNVKLRRDLAIGLYRLGSLADREKNEKAVTEAFQEARVLVQQLVDADEHNGRRQVELMKTLAHVGQIENAARIAERLNLRPNLDNELRVDIAYCYAQCGRFTPADQAETAQTYLVQSVTTLGIAIDNGFKDHVLMQTEPDLDPLRSRGDFQALLAKIRLPR